MCNSISHPLAPSHGPCDPRAYVNVDIFGVKFKGLLDSGATGSLMNSTGWAKIAALGHRLENPNPQQVSLADGTTQAIAGSVMMPVLLDANIHLT